MPSLTSLSLQSCVRLTNAALLELPRLPRLRHLNLRGCLQLSDAGLAAGLSGLVALEVLNLQGCTAVTGEGQGGWGVGARGQGQVACGLGGARWCGGAGVHEAIEVRTGVIGAVREPSPATRGPVPVVALKLVLVNTGRGLAEDTAHMTPRDPGGLHLALIPLTTYTQTHSKSSPHHQLGLVQFGLVITTTYPLNPRLS